MEIEVSSDAYSLYILLNSIREGIEPLELDVNLCREADFTERNIDPNQQPKLFKKSPYNIMYYGYIKGNPSNGIKLIQKSLQRNVSQYLREPAFTKAGTSVKMYHDGEIFFSVYLQGEEPKSIPKPRVLREIEDDINKDFRHRIYDALLGKLTLMEANYLELDMEISEKCQEIHESMVDEWMDPTLLQRLAIGVSTQSIGYFRFIKNPNIIQTHEPFPDFNKECVNDFVRSNANSVAISVHQKHKGSGLTVMFLFMCQPRLGEAERCQAPIVVANKSQLMSGYSDEAYTQHRPNKSRNKKARKKPSVVDCRAYYPGRDKRTQYDFE